MRTLITLLLSTFSLLQGTAQTTAIPDPNFEQKLISLGIDSDGTVNGQILNNDAAAVTYLDVNFSSIDSLIGIAAFINLQVLKCTGNYINTLNLSGTNLTTLYCNGNYISTLNLSGNTNLTTLYCEDNFISTLDISNNTNLIYLNCNNNNLDTLDLTPVPNLDFLSYDDNNIDTINLVPVPNLTFLGCGNNNINTLDLSSVPNVSFLSCDNNNLDSLDLTHVPNLNLLYCNNNNLSVLDLTPVPNLTKLHCSGNNLSALNLVPVPNLMDLNCPFNKINTLDLVPISNLTSLGCNNNNLSVLDLTPVPNLTQLYCSENNLSALNLASVHNLTKLYCSGNNLSQLNASFLNLFQLNCTNNSPLLEICVSSVSTASTSSWFQKDSSATWIENCAYPKAATGTITIDNNNNCTADSTEQTWANQLLKFEKGATTIYAATNDSGDYVAHLDTGTYTVSIVEDYHPYWTACPNSQTITVDTNYNLQTLDFVVQPSIQCPYLEVDISAPFLRRCFDNNYSVNYCNNGTIDAQNAYVEVELDTTLYYNSSTATLLSQVGNIYRFDVGSLAVGACGSFSINVTVSCNAPLGQIHCATAHISPDSLCLSSLNDIQITDSCSNDTILYQVTNYADAFASPLSYIILEDTTIVDTGSIQLAMGQAITISYYTGGNTNQYQLLIAQGNSDYYTISQRRSCNNTAVNMEMPYHPTVQHPSIAFDCQNNRGSYDPNDKRAMQKGAGLAHYIYPNTPLEYHIRFQNTGTDTAIFINILDTLSPFLDLATLEMGASSHPYTWELRPAKPTGEKVLKITFDPIYLPDSNVNEAASHGFVKFKINQQPNLPNQTLIENSAAIYFDYNAPIITNTAFHTVCDNCLDVNITSNGGVITSTLETKEAQSFQIYPNPTTGQLYIQQASTTEATLNLYNINGQRLLQQQIQSQLTTLELHSYPAGAYILQVQTAKGTENYKVIRQ